eukprot:CAMPEP_0170514288 /NCGR_PEP_ID=MMETSP0209-20121228/859_1 /TAXON_ID=665100 ORGANISM="Litonotus pictus, Strain P1" /NCGR_SAMPLE_ID=MMETSP0209 /ASSEMBLY_ACC=CAM_ASM_000301 /LENGTH=425 /DNA_ID=CAMNT_0010798321 /DNA_START=27 /DNA_END=1304 /DNA_ORIENTATION=+
MKIAVSGIKKETITTSNKKFAKFIKFLKNFGSLALIKEELTYEKLTKANLLIISGPRQYYKQKDIEAIQKYLEEGGSVYIALGEGGNEKNNTNLNDLIESYGISFSSDSVIRTSYSKYLHPKECYIEEGQFHADFSRTIKTTGKRKKIMTNDDLLDQVNDDTDEDKIKVVYPYGCSLKLKSSKISTVFNSGIISYPLKRPLMAAVSSMSKKGRLLVVGSEGFTEDEYFEKEDNKKIIESAIKWLLKLSMVQLEKASKDVELQNYTFTPNIVSIAENIKSCLEETKDPPKNFNDMFDTTMFSVDNHLVPEALNLYSELNVKHETLGIIPPQFETPLPPLQLAVFDPIIKDFDNPSLELYDLDEQFASEKIKLAQITNKCTDGDVEYYIKDSSDILGITAKIEKKGDPKAILNYIFNELANYKKLNP